VENGWIAIPPETLEVAAIEGVDALCSVAGCGDEVQVIEDGTTAHPSEFGFIKGTEHLVLRQMEVARVPMLLRNALATFEAEGRGLILPLVSVLKVSTNPCAQTLKGPAVRRVLQAE